MPSTNTLLGVAAFVVAALVAVGAVYALAGMGHGSEQVTGTQETPATQPGAGHGMGGMGGQPFQAGPAGGGPGFGMDSGGHGDCWMEGGMGQPMNLVEVSGIVVGFNAESMELTVETSDGETITVKVMGVYVDSETGALVFGPWIAANLEEGVEVTLLIAEEMSSNMGGDHGGMEGAGSGSPGEHGSAFTMMMGITVDGKEYLHPMVFMVDHQDQAGQGHNEGGGPGGMDGMP